MRGWDIDCHFFARTIVSTLGTEDPHDLDEASEADLVGGDEDEPAKPRHASDQIAADPGAIDPELGLELDRILSDRLVTMMYQPITSLQDGSVVGYEALARGPEGSPLASPAAMFAAAQDVDRVKELDLHCQTQAVVQARDVLLKSGHALFVNVEPSVIADAAFGRDPDAVNGLSSLLANVSSACPVVLEIADRFDDNSPAELLGVVMWARAQGFRIAIDDFSVGSLPLLPLLEPDVVKLAPSILTAEPDADLGLVLSVVRGQAERTGAAVVAQGIETDEDRAVAMSMGATHVQGFGVGLPAELSEAPLRIRSLEPVRASYAETANSPFELVANSLSTRTGPASLVEAFTLDLERQAASHPGSVVLSSFERGVSGRREIRDRYEALGETSSFVVALGVSLGQMQDVYSGGADPAEALSGERAIVVLTPHLSAALLARVAADNDGDREFAYALVYDRGLVTRAARLLIEHIEA
jgi:EAL domain-containing protein (putative c-di-GMP-specific phosphodiesterase class I)